MIYDGIVWVVFKAFSLKPALNVTCLAHLLPSAAYQLRVCQPPPLVANAEILAEDDEFEIGKNGAECLMIICLCRFIMRRTLIKETLPKGGPPSQCRM